MNNRLHNCKNPYQGGAKKILCVCSAGLLRSPTTAIVLQREYGYNTRAAGIDTGHALIPVDEVLITWADEIVCMDAQQMKGIHYLMDRMDKEMVGGDAMRAHNTPIHVLNVPDRYDYMDEFLQNAILEKYKEVVGDNKVNS